MENQDTVKTVAVPLCDRSPGVIQSFVDSFREVFANQPYGQYVFGKESKKVFSAQDIHRTDQYISAEQLEAIDLDDLSERYGESVTWWHEREKTKGVFKKKLSLPNSFLSLSKKSLSGEIAGASCAYESSVQDAFWEYEEWGNPYLYSGMKEALPQRDFELFLRCLNTSLQKETEGHIPFTAETKVLVWNCIFTMPKQRGLRHFYDLIHGLSVSIFESSFDQRRVLLTELIKNSTSEKILRVSELFQTNFMLGPDHDIYGGLSTAKSLHSFRFSHQYFKRKMLDKVRLE